MLVIILGNIFLVAKMSNVQEYPPDEILNPTDISGKKFEYIILWMLSKNETCQWSNFLSDPLNIQQSTLSNHFVLPLGVFDPVDYT